MFPVKLLESVGDMARQFEVLLVRECLQDNAAVWLPWHRLHECHLSHLSYLLDGMVSNCQSKLLSKTKHIQIIQHKHMCHAADQGLTPYMKDILLLNLKPT